MTKIKEEKSISDFFAEGKTGVLVLVLEELLAPAPSWSCNCRNHACEWSAVEHLTLEDFQRDCEWDEDWSLNVIYGVGIPSIEKRIPGVSTEDEVQQWMDADLDVPELDADDWGNLVANHPPYRTYHDVVETRVCVRNLRFKDNATAEKKEESCLDDDKNVLSISGWERIQVDENGDLLPKQQEGDND